MYENIIKDLFTKGFSHKLSSKHHPQLQNFHIMWKCHCYSVLIWLFQCLIINFRQIIVSVIFRHKWSKEFSLHLPVVGTSVFSNVIVVRASNVRGSGHHNQRAPKSTLTKYVTRDSFSWWLCKRGWLSYQEQGPADIGVPKCHLNEYIPCLHCARTKKSSKAPLTSI